MLSRVTTGATPAPVHLTPTSYLPGSNVLQALADGLDSWALIAAMVGVVIGAVIWAFGHYSQKHHGSAVPPQRQSAMF